MADSRVASTPELRQAAASCRIRLGSEADVDLTKVEQHKATIRGKRDGNDTEILENALDTIERIRTLKNKLSFGD